MYGKIIAVLAVAACIASASGACYPGYGVYCNNGGVLGCSLPVVSTGAVATPVVSTSVATPVVSTNVVAPVVSSRIVSRPVLATSSCSAPLLATSSCYAPDVCNNCRSYVTPLYRDTVGCPEVLASCENTAVGIC